MQIESVLIDVLMGFMSARRYSLTSERNGTANHIWVVGYFDDYRLRLRDAGAGEVEVVYENLCRRNTKNFRIRPAEMTAEAIAEAVTKLMQPNKHTITMFIDEAVKNVVGLGPARVVWENSHSVRCSAEARGRRFIIDGSAEAIGGFVFSVSVYAPGGLMLCNEKCSPNENPKPSMLTEKLQGLVDCYVRADFFEKVRAVAEQLRLSYVNGYKGFVNGDVPEGKLSVRMSVKPHRSPEGVTYMLAAEFIALQTGDDVCTVTFPVTAVSEPYDLAKRIGREIDDITKAANELIVKSNLQLNISLALSDFLHCPTVKFQAIKAGEPSYKRTLEAPFVIRGHEYIIRATVLPGDLHVAAFTVSKPDGLMIYQSLILLTDSDTPKQIAQRIAELVLVPAIGPSAIDFFAELTGEKPKEEPVRFPVEVTIKFGNKTTTVSLNASQLRDILSADGAS